MACLAYGRLASYRPGRPRRSRSTKGGPNMTAMCELSAAELAQIEGGITFVYGSLTVSEFSITKTTD